MRRGCNSSRRPAVADAIVFGTAALARSADPRALVRYARDRGIRAFDLAADDDVAVAALAGIAGDDVALFVRATPAVRFDLPSPHIAAGQAWPGERLRHEVEGLLARTGCTRIATLVLDAWCPEWLGEGDWGEAAGRLRAEGKIGGVGISLFDGDVDAGIDAVARGAVDRLWTMFNLFDTGAALNLLPLARERGIAVAARAPLYYGTLCDGLAPHFAGDDPRAHRFFADHRRETAERAARIADDLLPGETLAEVATRFALSHPAIESVTIGLRTPAQVDAALAAAAKGPLPPERLRTLLRHRWLCLPPPVR